MVPSPDHVGVLDAAIHANSALLRSSWSVAYDPAVVLRTLATLLECCVRPCWSVAYSCDPVGVLDAAIHTNSAHALLRPFTTIHPLTARHQASGRQAGSREGEACPAHR